MNVNSSIRALYDYRFSQYLTRTCIDCWDRFLGELIDTDYLERPAVRITTICASSNSETCRGYISSQIQHFETCHGNYTLVDSTNYCTAAHWAIFSANLTQLLSRAFYLMYTPYTTSSKIWTDLGYFPSNYPCLHCVTAAISSFYWNKKARGLCLRDSASQACLEAISEARAIFQRCSNHTITIDFPSLTYPGCGESVH